MRDALLNDFVKGYSPLSLRLIYLV